MKRVLVVEDEQDVAELVADVLALEGYTARMATGESVVAEAAAFGPDVVLLDLMMPGIDGFEVARRLRREPQTVSIPIVVMTAMHDAAARARELGAEGYIAKPFDIGELIRIIERTAS
jgi:DNA-binding response OmpR family regulator